MIKDKALLSLIEDDASLTSEQLSAMLGKPEDEIAAELDALRGEGVILGEKTLIDWDKTDREYVTAFIEVKIQPQRGLGFDKVAERIYNYPESKAFALCRAA